MEAFLAVVNFALFLATVSLAVTAHWKRKAAEAAGATAAESAAAGLEKAAAAAGRSADAAARSAAATEKVAGIETAREAREQETQTLARLTASVRNSGNTKQLVVTNGGRAAATGVRVLVAGRPFKEHAGLIAPFPEPAAARIDPEGELIGGFVVIRNPERVDLPATVRLEWRDPSGDDRSWEGQVG